MSPAALFEAAAALDDAHVGAALLGAFALLWLALGPGARARALASLRRSFEPPRE